MLSVPSFTVSLLALSELLSAFTYSLDANFVEISIPCKLDLKLPFEFYLEET